jgi:hypothetical protein
LLSLISSGSLLSGRVLRHCALRLLLCGSLLRCLLHLHLYLALCAHGQGLRLGLVA